MKPTVHSLFLLLVPVTLSGQTVLKLSLAQAIALAASGANNPSVQLAEVSLRVADAHRAQARSLLYPNLESSFTEQNVTRNLAAEGFNFPTGVPNFTIPQGVGPFNTLDVRVLMQQNVMDLGAFRRSRGLRYASEAARADIAVHRERSAAQVAHDYLAVLNADALSESASAAVAISERLLAMAQDRVDNGRAAALEVTRAKVRLAADHRKVTAAENDRAQSRLQLLNDLCVDLDTPLELTDRLTYAIEPVPDAQSTMAAALRSRPELQVSQLRQEEARSNDSAVRLDRVPTVIAYGDVGPLASVVTHTVGVSVRIPIFDGGRRATRREETRALVQQSEIQQRELTRQVELQVRRAAANLRAAGADIAACDDALSLADEGLAQAVRRFEGGVAGNLEVVDAQALLAQGRENRIAAVYAWNQARIDLAQSQGTITSVSMPPANQPGRER